MVIFPKAKINIGLRIIEKRSDGFHNLETIFYPVCLCDAIEFVVPLNPLRDDDLIISGSLAEMNPSNNLVIKAVKTIREIRNFPRLRIYLLKSIPAGAGLGGGSSDASNMLKSLNSFFELGIGEEVLKEISLKLGSDCPFFIESSPSFATGRGEILSPVKPLPEGLHLVLVNPALIINTKEAYNNCEPAQPDSRLMDLYNLDISQWKDLIINDFEKSVFKIYPLLSEIKKRLYEAGAVYSSMSGSGSTVYGIFRSKPQIPEALRKWVIYTGKL